MLSNISAFSILLPALVVFITLTRQTKTLKKLSVFVLVTAGFEASAYYYQHYGINNMFLFHVYSYIEVFAMAWIFWDLQKNWMRTVIEVSLLFYLAFSIVNINKWETLLEFNSNQRYVAAIVIIGFTLLYYVKLFSEAKIQKVEQDHYFWFSSILLIYTAGTLFLFIVNKELQLSGSSVYWEVVHSIFNILLNFGFTLTLWMGTRRSN